MTNSQLGPKIAQGRTAEVFAWGEDHILKLYRPGWPKQEAEHEHRKALASQQTGLAVPAVGELVTIEDRHGIVYQRVEGVTLMSAMRAKLWQVKQYARLLAQLQADMHSRQTSSLTDNHQRLKAKINHTDLLDEPTKQILCKHLDQLPNDNKLLHGDFHPDNVLIKPNDEAVIIDWVDASQGHPLGDLARTSILLTAGDIPAHIPARRLILIFRSTFHKIFMDTYLKLSLYTQQDLAPWIPIVAAARLSENIPEENDILIKIIHDSL